MPANQISVRSSLFWMALSQGGLFVLQFGGSVIMARLLSPEELGIYAAAAAIVGILGIIRAFGLQAFLIREPELTPDIIACVFTINALLALFTAALVVLLAHAGALFLKEPGVRSVMQLLALIPLISVFEFLPGVRLERIGAFRVVAALNFIRVLVATILTLWLASIGWSYISIAYGTLAAGIITALGINIVGWRFVSLRIGFRDWRRVTRFGLQLLTISAIGNIAIRLTDLLVARFLGLAALGIYNRAAGLNNLLWDNLHMVIARIVFVDFAERQRRGLPLRDTYLRIVAMVTGLLWPAFTGLAILAGPIILTVYGPAWTAAAIPLSMLALAGLVLTAITMTGEVFVVVGETARQVRFEIKRTLFGVLVFTAGCSIGLNAAAGARIVEAVATLLFVKEDLKRMTGTATADYPRIYAQSTALTLAACTPAALIMAWYGWALETPLPILLAGVAAGVLCWIALLWRFRHPLYLEAETLIARRLRPAQA